jgi:S-(hydroxymethyl)glutathione dehydrogenase / alcohol dehydrogenase
MPKTTEAAVLYILGKPLCITTLEIPDLKPGQVLVDISYSGLCHSQLNEARGLKGEDKFLPHTLGHEGSGKVLAVGNGVKKVKPGDSVVLTWIKGSGADVPSTTYLSADGAVNSGAISTFMHHTVTCESRLVPIADVMPLPEAALLGCAIPTGAGIVLNTIDLPEGNTIAIFGVGGIGLSAIMAAVLRKAKMIIAVDIFDHKLEQAKDLGATHVIHARKQDPLAVIMELTSKKGVDCAIESAGRKETMENAFKAIRENGGLCVLAGNLPHGEKISIDPMDLIRGKKITGTWGGETQPDRDIPVYVNYYLAGKLKLDRLLTHTYSLKNINQAMDDLENGKIGRALIDMSLRH